MYKTMFIYIDNLPNLLYGCTWCTLTKRTEKKLEGGCTRMLRAVLNKSYTQHLTKQQHYRHLLSISKITQVRRGRHGKHSWKSKNEIINDILLLTPSYVQVLDDPKEYTYNSPVWTQNVDKKTCQGRWMIETIGERERERERESQGNLRQLRDLVMMMMMMMNNLFW